jgi:hypothetical protein
LDFSPQGVKARLDNKKYIKQKEEFVEAAIQPA